MGIIIVGSHDDTGSFGVHGGVIPPLPGEEREVVHIIRGLLSDSRPDEQHLPTREYPDIARCDGTMDYSRVMARGQCPRQIGNDRDTVNRFFSVHALPSRTKLLDNENILGSSNRCDAGQTGDDGSRLQRMDDMVCLQRIIWNRHDGDNGLRCIR